MDKRVEMNNANRVIYNTLILYVRLFLTVGISFYSVRLVLNALGATDYGIYNLIAGVIAMLSFLNVAMSVSTQRYLSFYQGKKDLKMQKNIFANSLLLHILIGLGLVCILEMVGYFLFDGFLNIPVERIYTAKVIYHFMSLTVFFTVISVPFVATLNARENMLWIAFVTTFEILLKLGIACLLYVVTFDKLIVYALLTSAVSVISLLLYSSWCLVKYEECSLKMKGSISSTTLRELSSFAGWNLFGALCGIGKTQGLAVVFNIFLGTVVNAAYGIANQVAGQMNFFSESMLRSINPQIMKSEGAGERDRMLRLSMMASKFGFFLLAFIAIPFIFEMPSILKFWLGNVPDYTVMFCNMILISVLANQLTIGLQSAFQAIGNIKVYQFIVGGILLLNLPISVVFLENGFPVFTVLISYICIELISCMVRIVLLKKLAGLSIKEYVQRVFLKEVFPLAVIVIVSYLSTTYFHFQYRFLLTIPLAVLSFAFAILFGGLCEDERMYVINLLNRIRTKKRNESSK